MNMEDDKTNEPHKFIFNLSQRLNLTLIWVGLLGVCFEVGGEVTPCLKLVRIMLAA